MPDKPQGPPPRPNPTRGPNGPVGPARPKPKYVPPPAKEVGQSQSDLPPALAGLLASLPKNGMSWTKGKRDSFINAFSTVLDFVYPITETDENDGGQ